MASKSPFQPTAAQIQRAAEEHLPYEINMLRRMAKLLDVSPSLLDAALSNAAIESFAAHLRLLSNFFWDSGDKDDMTAIHFMDSNVKWRPDIAGEKPDVIKEACERANKEIVHLTYKRIEMEPPEKKAWPIRDLMLPMENVIALFLKHARSDLVAHMKLVSKWEQEGIYVDLGTVRVGPSSSRSLLPGSVATGMVQPVNVRWVDDKK